MPEYWIGRDGQQLGPYSAEDLRRMIAEGRASATDYVWKDGMTGWEPLAQVILVSGPAPPPPPPKPHAYAGAQPAPAVASRAPSSLVPPSLHWAFVLLFTILTFGLFYSIWCLREASFVKKLDRGSSSLLLMVLAVIGQIGVDILYFAALAQSDPDARIGLFAIEILVYLVSVIFYVVAVFQMRRSLINHYNIVEPISLRLSGIMTLFFSGLYFQHHFSRIANWKQTGHLKP